MTTAPASRALIEFIHELRFEALPSATLEAARRSLVDTLGCAFFGSRQIWARLLVQQAVDEAGPGRCTVLGTSALLPAPSAALCNGTAAHGFELDDLLDEAVVHPGAIVIPAALAAAEACGASGERLLVGIVAGYEMMQRVGLALGKAPMHQGFHKTALVGPLGAAAAAGVVLGLSYEHLTAAIGLACSTASGIKSFAAGEGGGMVKRLHAGHASANGVRMAQLAGRGFTAPPRAIDGPFGMLEVYGGEDADATHLARDLGIAWADTGLCLKIYPICGWIQSTVQGLVSLRGQAPLPAASIDRVRVGVSAYAARNNASAQPIDTMGAQYSIPYCAATALAGDPGDPLEYGADVLADPDRRALARRVDVVVDPEMEAAYPRHYGARVQLLLANGEQRETAILDPHGVTFDPCSMEEVALKFRRLAASALTDDKAQALLNAIRRCELLPDARAITQLARA